MTDRAARAAAGPSLRDAKQALRTAVVAARDALDSSHRAKASHQITARIAVLPSFLRSRTILLNLPFRSEWDSALLAEEALAAGKRLVVPRVDAIARMLMLHEVSDPEREIAPGYRQIPEPLPSLPEVRASAVDWVLVPGVAFDLAGRRIGYGGGYYDRLLPTLRRDTPRVAGAFEVQVVDRVPAAPHDMDVDCLVTERRVIEIHAPA